MDDITHALAGTLLAQAHPSKRKGLILACVAGALVPDIDIVLTLWGRHLYLTEHRGFTHSLLGVIPMSLFAAGIAWAWVRKKKDPASFGMLWLFALTGVISHILLDWCTSWGTMILWPNRTRFALDYLFIIDLWYASCLAMPLLAGLYWKEYRVKISLAGLALVLAYHGLTAFNHQRALGLVRMNEPQVWKAAFPLPFSPFRWSIFGRADGVLDQKRVDLLKADPILGSSEWKAPFLTPELQQVMDSPQGKKYLWFARVPVWEEEEQKDGTSVIRFWDMRFQNYLDNGQAQKRFGTVFQVKEGHVTGGDF